MVDTITYDLQIIKIYYDNMKYTSMYSLQSSRSAHVTFYLVGVILCI